jgi:hypothetical protein
MRLPLCWLLTFAALASAEPSAYFENPPPVAPLAPPLSWPDHLSTPHDDAPQLPIADTPFEEHVQRKATGEETEGLMRYTSVWPIAVGHTPLVRHSGRDWAVIRGGSGLMSAPAGTSDAIRHLHYGDGQGPASTAVTGLAVDSNGTLWVSAIGGLSARDKEGNWTTWRGKEGLPVLALTSVVVDEKDHLWIGSEKGLIHFRPDAEGRQWFYRQGRRYLPDDHVEYMAVKEGRVLVKTKAGWTSIETVEHTLQEKAEYFLARYEDRHRRLGMPSPALYTAPEAMDSWTHEPQPSDGLWTSYQVTSMALAFAITGEARYRELAREGMEALYLLQNVTGIPGLVARSVVTIDEPTVPRLREMDNWHETADGAYLWRDDVSSDQITGHFLAFYTYFEHIAKYEPAGRARLEKQLRQVLDYILDNNYQIIDWHGERTLWGWWNPEMLEDPEHYLESGLYALMMLSFLKTAHYITGDEKYLEHFKKLILEHDYLSKILVQKWVAPDEINHSDDQLSAVTFYPFLQMEKDPVVRDVLHRALRKHARIDLPERNSLLALVYATIAPEDADVEGALQTLREMPLDRRNWRHENLHRDDVVLQREKNVGGQILTRDVLPADERHFERWNADPYEANTGGDGTLEGDGIQWLLPYWLARYHGILAMP